MHREMRLDRKDKSYENHGLAREGHFTKNPLLGLNLRVGKGLFLWVFVVVVFSKDLTMYDQMSSDCHFLSH